MEPFCHTFRVRYAEVDPQSVVFNSRYLEYADILVTEFYRDRRAHGMLADIEFHVRRAEVDYLRPIRGDELIEGRLSVERIGTSSIEQRVALHGADEGELRAEITIIAVHVELPIGQPMRVPDSVRRAFGFPVTETAHG
ncbi:acyl-CoA thioesterase [Qipengyuania marisflavi]|uniref:Acyl-CoA thioesterase n=1 Tax=Qipengyuania marisflavi TaxID=2486356 RepID=A0A5S3P5J8_9SPHN|nr:thioesterase family protein [Qipengyuania marisflavi]TMM48101.1 acyl-CoA thioesterase [Qipengyuania marisflavi]